MMSSNDLRHFEVYDSIIVYKRVYNSSCVVCVHCTGIHTWCTHNATNTEFDMCIKGTVFI